MKLWARVRCFVFLTHSVVDELRILNSKYISFGDVVLVWLSVRIEVEIVCIWSS